MYNMYYDIFHLRSKVYNVTNFILDVSCGVGGPLIKKKKKQIIL
jgi:hypothetical protein